MSIHRIHHIECGTMCPMAAPLVGSPGRIWQRGTLVCHCILVESDAGLILIDTGFSTEDLGPNTQLHRSFLRRNPPRKHGPTAKSAIEDLGYRCEDVRYVIPTHLDLDHAGGLLHFPDAQVHVFRSEWVEATAQRKKPNERYVQAHWAHGPNWQLHEADGEPWNGFDSVHPIPGLEDELALLPLHGHSAGLAGVVVKDSKGWILHAGDAFFHRNALQPAGKVPLGLRLFERSVDFDRRARMDNQDRLRELHASMGESIRVICSHDPIQLERCQRGEHPNTENR